MTKASWTGFMLPASSSRNNPMTYVTPSKDQTLSTYHKVFALLLGCAIPAGAFGVAATMAFSILTMIAALAVTERAKVLRSTFYVLRNNKLAWLAMLMLLTWIPGIFNSYTPCESIKTWLRISALLGFSLYLYNLFVMRSEICNQARNIILITAFTVLTLSLTTILVFPDIVSAIREPGREPWLRYKAFASASATLVPLLAWIACHHVDWRRWLALATIVGCLMMLSGTQTRAAMAGLAAAGVISTFILSIHKPKTRLTLIGLAVLGVVGLYWYLTNRPLSRGIHTGPLGLPVWLIDLHRQYIWDFVVHKIPDALWFGYGINAVAHIPGANEIIGQLGIIDSKPVGIWAQYIPSHPHNWILEIFSETGIFGILSTIAFIFCLIWRDLVSAVRTGSSVHTTRLCTSVFFWASSCFSFSIWAPWWGISYVFVYILCSFPITRKAD